jgi:hypothetical protein
VQIERIILVNELCHALRSYKGDIVSYRILGIDVDRRILAVVVTDLTVEVCRWADDDFQAVCLASEKRYRLLFDCNVAGRSDGV